VKNPDGTQGYSSNPIRGLCPVRCWYCYESARRRRFKIPPHFEFHRKELREIEQTKKPRGIFLGSVIELFHEAIPYDWRGTVFKTIRACPQHRFYILTKLPQNIDRPMPDNVWLGVSVIKGDDDGWMRLYWLKQASAKLKFVSFEPMLGRLNTPIIVNAGEFDWYIFGRLTRHGKKFDPKKDWLKFPIEYLKHVKGKPIFLKDNLRDIWGPDLIQEMPE